MKWFRKKNKREFIRLHEQEAQKLAQLGTQLRLKRQENNLSLEQVAAKTLIRPGLLQAIEEGKIDQLPEPIYIQGFIKQYADALGFDGNQLASTFPISDRRLSIKPAWINLPATQLQPIHLYLLYIIVVIAAVNTLSHMLSRSEFQASNQFEEQPLITSATKRQQIPPPPENLKPVSATPSDPKDSSKPLRIDITLKASSWLRVVADGKTLFEGILPQGTQRTWVAHKEVTVRAGNAGGVLVTLNQQQVKPMGNFGEVQEVTFAGNQEVLMR